MESLDNDSDDHNDTIMVVEEETVLEVASTVEESMRKYYHSALNQIYHN